MSFIVYEILFTLIAKEANSYVIQLSDFLKHFPFFPILLY